MFGVYEPRYDTLVNRVLSLARSRPDKLAAAFKKERMTYGELAEKTRRAGAGLRRMGVRRGDRVLLAAVSRPELAAAYLGIQYCGGTAVFVDRNAVPELAAFLYRETGAVLFLTDRPMKEHGDACRLHSLKGLCAAGPEEPEEDEVPYTMPEETELAELLFTTGTTGRPKGVMLSYRAVYHILRNTMEGVGMREEDRVLLPLPMNHSFALRVLRAALYRGASVIFQNGFTFAREIENNLDAYQCTALAVVPASVETIARQMQGRFAEIMGRFRYIEASAGALTPETIRDGWLLTGDLAYRDADGYVYMLGRADDIINVGGEKVSPVEVENLAGEYPSVRECACVGVPDPEGILGFVPVLFVAPGGGEYSEEGLRAFLAERLERHKLPVRYVSLPEIPRNPMRKIDRKKLRELWESQGSEPLMNPVLRAILTRRSIRRFEERAIPREVLNMILRAGYHAPSGHNMQTWRFTVLEDREKIARLKEAARTAAAENQVYFYGFENPACVILISNDERNRYGCQDASCAAENIFLAAHSYGIGSVWLNPLMTLRKKEPVKRLLDEFGVPENHAVWCMAALGYPLEEGALLAKREDVAHFVE